MTNALQAEEALGLANVMSMGGRNRLQSGESSVGIENMLRRFSLSWICSPKFRRLAKRASYFDNGSGSLWDDGDTGNSDAITVHGSGSKRVPKILDYDAHISTFANPNDGFLGNFSDIVLTYFTSIDVVVDQRIVYAHQNPCSCRSFVKW